MFRLLWVFLTALLLSAGCSRYFAPGVGVNGRGPRIDTETAILQDTLLINVSGQPVFFDVEGRGWDYFHEFIQVNSGDLLIKEMRTYQRLHISIIWFPEAYRDQLGYSQENMILERHWLYPDKPLIITDLMLQGMSRQRGVIYNVGHPVNYSDDQGHSLDLQTGESKIIYLASGPLNFYTRPISPKYHPRLHSHIAYIDRRKAHVPWEQELLDFRIVLRDQWPW